MTPDSYYFRLISGEQKGAIATVFRGGLTVLAWAYGAVIRLRNARYDRGGKAVRRVTVPVVSIGNLTTGGTGKTPMVIWVLQELIGLGRRPGVLMRGYKARVNACCRATEAFRQAVEGCENDEAREIRRRCPQAKLIVNPDRLAGAHAAIDQGCDVLVMDDGFQHRRLGRDLDVVLIDATVPFGHEAMLPRGMLREPATSLRRAHLLVITRSDQISPESLANLRRRIATLAPDVPVLSAAHRPVELCDPAGRPDAQMPVSSVAGRHAWVFAGLGNPAAFIATVERMGFVVVGRQFWPDHHTWTDDELDTMARQAAAAKADMVLTTEKDAVRLPPDRPAWPAPLRVVRVAMTFADHEGATARELLIQAITPKDATHVPTIPTR